MPTDDTQMNCDIPNVGLHMVALAEEVVDKHQDVVAEVADKVPEKVEPTFVVELVVGTEME